MALKIEAAPLGYTKRELLALHPALKSRALRWLLAPGGRRLLGLHAQLGWLAAQLEAALEAPLLPLQPLQPPSPAASPRSPEKKPSRIR